MFRVLPVVFLASACATTAAPVERPDFDAALAEHLRAVQARDLDAYVDTITERPDFSIIFPNGHRTTSRQEAIDFHRAWFADESWRMTFTEVERIDRGDTVIVVLATEYRDAPDGEPRSGWLTLGFGIEGGRWRLVLDQNTRIVVPKTE